MNSGLTAIPRGGKDAPGAPRALAGSRTLTRMARTPPRSRTSGQRSVTGRIRSRPAGGRLPAQVRRQPRLPPRRRPPALGADRRRVPVPRRAERRRDDLEIVQDDPVLDDAMGLLDLVERVRRLQVD